MKISDLQLCEWHEPYDKKDLESFRQHCVRQLLNQKHSIEEISKEITGLDGVFEPAGDVLDPDKFRPNSKIKGLYVVRNSNLPAGILDHHTDEMQKALGSLSFTFGTPIIEVLNMLS